MTLESNLTAAFQAVGTDMKDKANAAALNASALTSGTVPIARLPAGSVMSTTSVSVRPTARTDIRVHWHTPEPPTAVMVTGDTWIPTP